jgi:hypothetical protein
MNDFFVTVVAALAGTGVAAGLLAWLLSKWIGARIESSIKYEYDRLKIERESEHRRRERAQLVAELLAEWMATPLDGGMSTEQRARINKLSFEATLWLPEEIAAELSKVLQHDPTATNQFELLLRVRTLLSGPHNLTTKNVTQWDRERELPNRGLPPGFCNGQITVLEAKISEGEVVKPVTFKEVGGLFIVPDGSKTLLTFPKANATTSLVSTADVRSLKLVGSRTVDGEIAHITLEVFPKDLANALNRSLYGATSAVSTNAGSATSNEV